MERRTDPLFRAVVEQVDQNGLAPTFRLNARGTTTRRRWVQFTGPGPWASRRGRELVLFHAADQQYVGAHLRETGHRGPPRLAALWSYHPEAATRTEPAQLPKQVSAWAKRVTGPLGI